MKKFIFPIILAIISFSLYFNSLSNSFAYDDIPIIVKNPNIKFFKENLTSFFNLKYFNISKEATYRPVSTMTYFINYQFFQLNPAGYRFFNLLIHIINIILLFILLYKLFGSRLNSFIVCLLYLSHPLLTETLNCITFNEDILFSFFYI